jgi:hypothetical protein
MSALTYECTYRHVAFVLASMLVLVAAMIAAIVAAVSFVEDGNTSLAIVLYTVGAVLVLIILTAISAFATHRWTIEPAGVRVEEKPKVPFMGLSRRRTLAFADIAALRHLESGFDSVIEIAARDGAVYQLMANGAAVPELQAFAAQIAAAFTAAGRTPPAMTEGLSFWNRPIGLLMIVVMLILSLLIAGAAAWALLDGGLNSSRSSQFAGVAIALPFGAGYLLYKSLARRWRVLELLSKAG